MANPKGKILVVDDTDSTRYAVVRILKQAGYEVFEAKNGQSAISQLTPEIDLAVLDVRLPDMSGYDICEYVRRKEDLASIPILHASATHISGEDQAYGLNAGADAYLVHPVDPVVLVATVKALLRVRSAEQDLKATVQKLNFERESREQFVSMLSHDLRTPLTSVKFGAQSILRDPLSQTQIQKHGNRIVEAVDRIDQMIQNLLDASRIRSGEKIPLHVEHCFLNKVLSGVVDEFSVVNEGRFVLKCPPDIEGYWDIKGLRRSLENLCGNALKYGAENAPILVSAFEEGGSVSISVNNRGNPLTREEIDSLFLAFHRTRSAHQSGRRGWGLGLTLVKGFTESHGGEVSVTSSVEEGTTFTIRLPRDPRK